MKDSTLHFAIREMRGSFTSPRVLLVLGAISIILGISGPFGTSEFMRLPVRLVYWVAMVCVTFAAGQLVNTMLEHRREHRKLGFWIEVLIAAILTGTIIVIVVFLINRAAFGARITISDYAPVGLNAFVIGAITAVAFALESRFGSAPSAGPKTPPILDRLPFDLRGPLISISVQDHYVEVVTAKGAHLLLMRLSDAMAETSGTSGLQVHRSHWVALNAVQSGKRRGDRAVLTLKDSREIPVSRTYVKVANAAGLLLTSGNN